MLTWMAYSILVGALLCLAAGVLERTVDLFKARKRFLWLAAILGTFALLTMTLVPAAPAPAARMSRGDVDAILLAIWFVGIALCVGVLLFSAIRVAFMQRRWREEVVAGVPVRVSHDVGPAVVGLLHHGIVVPGWVCSLRDEEQRMVMSHEREHVRAGDPLLLWGTTLLVAVMPWNAVLWFALSRLRHAIEMDCDTRVLRAQHDARAYCSLLVDVGERTLSGAAPVVALAEPATLLERRIAAMTTAPRAGWRQVLAGTLAAGVLTVAACRTPQPEVTPRTRLLALATELNDLLHRDSVARTLTGPERESVRNLAQAATAANGDVPAGNGTVVSPEALGEYKKAYAEMTLERAAGKGDSKSLADLFHSEWNSRITRDQVLGYLAPKPDSVVARYYGVSARTNDTTDNVVVLRYDTTGKLIDHSMRFHDHRKDYSAGEFTDHDIYWFTVLHRAPWMPRIAVVVERKTYATPPGPANVGDAAAPHPFNGYTDKQLLGIQAEFLARMEYPSALHPGDGKAFVVGFIWNADGRRVQSRAVSFDEDEIFDASAPNDGRRRLRGDKSLLMSLFGGTLPTMVTYGSRILRDAPRTVIVFGEFPKPPST